MAQYEIQLPIFTGPLDLLLRIIEKEELDITTVALAQVTDQYMAYLAELERREVKELTNFLTVAAKLLLIKSLALLPRPPVLAPEAEDVGDELVRQLQAYKQFKKVASLLHEREKQGLHSFVRIAPLPRLDPQLDMGNVTLDDLLTVVREALGAVAAASAGEVVAPVTVTINDQISYIENRLIRRRQVRFRDILSEATTRVEVIVTLLALLELIKQDRVQVQQEQMFGDIVIEQSSDEPVDEPIANPAA